MRRLLLALCLLACAGPARAQLSPRLRMVARGQLPAAAISGTGTRALVTIRVAGGAEALRALGIEASAISRNVASARLDAATLAYLGAQPLPLRIEESRTFAPLLDKAAPAIGAAAARDATGLTGRGALVGIIDTGVDIRHEDLRNLDGTTRIAALLDLSTITDGGHADLGDFGGTIWLRDEIDATLAADAGGAAPARPVVERDQEGHGTHVASIAAGNGLATGNGFAQGRYVGIAPEAELLVARASDGSHVITDVTVLQSCRFQIERARALARPLVVNVSLGTASGPHDGSSNLELAFDELFPRDAAGLALVVAAGNEGSRDAHAGGWALDGEEGLPFEVGEGRALLQLELWTRGDAELAIESPGGARTDWVRPGTASDRALGTEGRVLIDAGDLTASARGAAVVIDGIGGAGPAAGRWTLWLRGRAIRYDAWLQRSPFRFRFLERVVADDRLALPATAYAAISVGAVRSRAGWPTADGRDYLPQGSDPLRLGGPTSFSSPGPTADGRFAPDVSAPGEFVIGAMSRDATPDVSVSSFQGPPGDESVLVADDGVHGALRGTSQAAPMVTGTIALLLEGAPVLTSEAIREILRATARPVPGTAGWSPKVGFGLVDPAAAIAYLRGTRGGAVSASASRVGVSRDLLPPDSDELTLVTVTPRDGEGRALGGGHAVVIELSAGAALGPVTERGGRYERAFVAHAPRGAVGEVRVLVDGVPLDAHPRVFFVPSRLEAGGNLVAGGGCAVPGRRAQGGVLTLGAALLLAFVARRRRAG